jgi:hypothetical protein
LHVRRLHHRFGVLCDGGTITRGVQLGRRESTDEFWTSSRAEQVWSGLRGCRGDAYLEVSTEAREHIIHV